MGGPGPELRRDALTGEWVSIAGSRQGRPNLPAHHCPFCVGGLEAPEPYEVRSFPNRWPSLVPGPALDEAERAGSAPGRGACEVVLYAPEHDASLATIGLERVRRVIDLWAERSVELMQRPEVEYVLVFENRGAEVGATIHHPHGQIYALPFVPPAARAEARAAADAGCCTVCGELGDELASGERVVCTAEGWVAGVPFAAAWPYAMLLAPERHVAHLWELSDCERDGFAQVLVDALGRYERMFSRPMPYMMWIHQGLHLHVHTAPPWRAEGVMRFVAAGEVGTGTYFNPVRPEDAAGQLRAAGA